jgi:hypothetical protein
VFYYDLPTVAQLQQAGINDNGFYVTRKSIPAKYEALLNYLASASWEEADRATGKVMLEVAGQTDQGYLEPDDLEKFPCPDLQTIDGLWIQFSGGHFGFSVQKQIWEEYGSITSYDADEWIIFSDRVGWREKGEWKPSHSYLQKNLELSPIGGLPVWWVVGIKGGRGFVGLFSRTKTCGL